MIWLKSQTGKFWGKVDTFGENMQRQRVVFHQLFDAVAENFQVAQIPMELGQSFCALSAPAPPQVITELVNVGPEQSAGWHTYLV